MSIQRRHVFIVYFVIESFLFWYTICSCRRVLPVSARNCLWQVVWCKGRQLRYCGDLGHIVWYPRPWMDSPGMIRFTRAHGKRSRRLLLPRDSTTHRTSDCLSVEIWPALSPPTLMAVVNPPCQRCKLYLLPLRVSVGFKHWVIAQYKNIFSLHTFDHLKYSISNPVIKKHQLGVQRKQERD